MTGQAGSNHQLEISTQRAGWLTCYTSVGWNLSGPLLLTLTLVHFALGWGGRGVGLLIKSNAQLCSSGPGK